MYLYAPFLIENACTLTICFVESSEMCDFIRTENIKSVIEHVVTKHIRPQHPPSSEVTDVPMKRILSLEEVATPYVDTLTLLRVKYEENSVITKVGLNEFPDGNVFNSDEQKLIQNERAREDQVRIKLLHEQYVSLGVGM